MQCKHLCATDKGFSLVELIVVIAIMAILAAVAIPTFAGFIDRAQEASDIAFMNDLEYAISLSRIGEDTAEIQSITVVIDPDSGAIVQIQYLTVYREGNLIKEDAHKIQAGSDAAAALGIDWDYRFHNKESLTESDMWRSHWNINAKTDADDEQVLPSPDENRPAPDDEFENDL